MSHMSLPSRAGPSGSRISIGKSWGGLPAPEEKGGGRFLDIIAVTLTTMRDTGVNLDADLRVLRPSILWVDERSVQCRAPMPAINRVLFALVGMLDAATANRANTKSNWIRENQPEIWEKTKKYVLLSCYLTYKFTGNLVDSVASQVGHIPFDYRHKRWMKTSQLKFPVFNVEPKSCRSWWSRENAWGKSRRRRPPGPGFPRDCLSLPPVRTRDARRWAADV